MKEVTIYTDGACSGNPGIGGWGAILMYKDKKREISGAEENTTNNQMEMTAVIKALEKMKESCKITIYSDSAYVVNAFLNDWITGWKMNNWRNASKDEVKNKALWQKLLNLMQGHDVEWVKVKGHADNEYNNRCDKLATTAIKEYKKVNNEEQE